MILRLSSRSLASLGFLLFAAAACEPAVEAVPVRSLERSGKTAFLCLANRGKTPGVSLDECGPYQTRVDDYSVPHLIALVTQTSRGEVAVVDVTGDAVIDANPSSPGFDFLPVGAQPTDIVATPGGTAAFVSVAEANRPGIFALPSHSIRGGSPELVSWPACSLPAVPGAMELLIDGPSVDGDESSIRATCDSERGEAHPALQTCDPALDLSNEAAPLGARKLLVTLPELGAIAVVDAQELLCRPPGSFDACPIERFWELRTDVLPYGVEAHPETTSPEALLDEDRLVCEAAAANSGIPAHIAQAHPGEIAITDPEIAGPKRIYISDYELPSIHVIDAPSPCEMAELTPLRPQSAVDPKRVVRTSAIAVSPLTHDEKRFVYAADLKEGSVMAFDVSLGSANPYPLIHPNALRDPLEPRDRIRFASPVRSIAFVTRDRPFIDENGVGHSGIQCNPSADASLAEASYRTGADFSGGAGPRNLRGIFGFLALESGQVITVDVDDWDAPCRRSNGTLSILGCGGEQTVSAASGEASCSVVERHRPRSAYYFAYENAHAPTMQAFPFLYGPDGVVKSGEQPGEEGDLPRLVGPDFSSSCSKAGTDSLDYVTVRFSPVVREEIKPTPDSLRNWVAFDLEEPRVHFEQQWTMTYEGELPGFSGRVGRLQGDGSSWELWDTSGGFCDKGVYDTRLAEGHATLASGDIVEVVEMYPSVDDDYWATVGDSCSHNRCQATFGTAENPTSARDFTIAEAYQDHLVLEGRTIRDATDPSRTLPLDCCFPYPISYRVRAKDQWIVTGSVSGFSHKVVANPETGRCEESCDPYLALRNSRVAEVPFGDKPCSCQGEERACGFGEESEYLFKNPQMQFSIWAGKSASERGMSFVFHESGGFVPLYANLAASTTLVSPQSMTYVPPLGELAIADGGLLGLAFINLNTVSVGRTFF